MCLAGRMGSFCCYIWNCSAFIYIAFVSIWYIYKLKRHQRPILQSLWGFLLHPCVWASMGHSSMGTTSSYASPKHVLLKLLPTQTGPLNCSTRTNDFRPTSLPCSCRAPPPPPGELLPAPITPPPPPRSASQNAGLKLRISHTWPKFIFCKLWKAASRQERYSMKSRRTLQRTA